jgi:hypothetical protein
MTLSLHNELSYADVWPSNLFFFCLVPAARGGETSIADSRRILAALDPGLVAKFRRRRLRYIRNLSPVKGSGYGWQEAFETDDPAEAERGCARIGAEFEWQEGGVLRISQVRDATAFHPETGEEVWFNQADGFHPSALLPDVYQAALAETGSEDRFRLNVIDAPIERAASTISPTATITSGRRGYSSTICPGACPSKALGDQARVRNGRPQLRPWRRRPSPECLPRVLGRDPQPSKLAALRGPAEALWCTITAWRRRHHLELGHLRSLGCRAIGAGRGSWG